MSDITLYDYELDEHCYKVRLLLSCLGVVHLKIAVDMYPGGEERQPALMALNPTGTLPILCDGALSLYGAEAIMLYLAHRYDNEKKWIVAEAAEFRTMVTWLQFASVQLAAAVTARRQALFGGAEDMAEDMAGAIATAKRAFRIMEDHMTLREIDGADWFVGSGATLADLAVFPAIALSRDFAVEHEAYPALRRWMRRVRGLAGFIVMPGIPSYY